MNKENITLLVKKIPWLYKALWEIKLNVADLVAYCTKLAYCKKCNKTNDEYNKQKIEALKDKYKGERCFIVGSGPSLTIEQLELIKGEYTFGVNADFMLYEKSTWRASSYAVIDDSVLEKYENQIDAKDLDYFFYGSWSHYSKENGICLPVHNANNFTIDNIWHKLFPYLLPSAKFSDDISKILYTGKSVVYSLLQIAVYMGFKEIYLIGVDCSYKPGNLYNRDIKHEDGIDPAVKYRNGLQMIKQYEVAEKWTKKNGIKIYNASAGGELNIFARVNLDEVIEDGN